MQFYCSKCEKEFDVKPNNAVTFIKTVKPLCPSCHYNKHVGRIANMEGFECGEIKHKKITRHRDTQFAKNTV